MRCGATNGAGNPHLDLFHRDLNAIRFQKQSVTLEYSKMPQVIEIKNLDFSYGRSQPALEGALASGQRRGLTLSEGQTGALHG